jgi:hypothetical protein
LDTEEIFNPPIQLFKNNNQSFLGSGAVGTGFLISIKEAEKLLSNDKINEEVVKLFITGDDINSSVHLQPSRYCIYFRNWSNLQASKYKNALK